jgi:hypothetical protein
MVQYKVKDVGVLEGIMKFVIYTELNIVDDIQIRKLGSAVPIIRMEDERIPSPPKKGS